MKRTFPHKRLCLKGAVLLGAMLFSLAGCAPTPKITSIPDAPASEPEPYAAQSEPEVGETDGTVLPYTVGEDLNITVQDQYGRWDLHRIGETDGKLTLYAKVTNLTEYFFYPVDLVAPLACESESARALMQYCQVEADGSLTVLSDDGENGWKLDGGQSAELAFRLDDSLKPAYIILPFDGKTIVLQDAAAGDAVGIPAPGNTYSYQPGQAMDLVLKNHAEAWEIHKVDQVDGRMVVYFTLTNPTRQSLPDIDVGNAYACQDADNTAYMELQTVAADGTLQELPADWQLAPGESAEMACVQRDTDVQASYLELWFYKSKVTLRPVGAD